MPTQQKHTGMSIASASIWDGVFTNGSFTSLLAALSLRPGSKRTIFDRHSYPAGRSAVEATLLDLLREMEDSTRFVEYWWRDGWSHLPAHRDIDEDAFTERWATGERNHTVLYRYPVNAHVLYGWMDVGARAPTCVFQETNTTTLQHMLVVPAVAGRLLRFPGGLLHAAPRPALDYLDAEHALWEVLTPRALTESVTPGRAILAFNTWDEPPRGGVEPTRDEVAQQQQQQGKCNPSSEWLSRAPLQVGDLGSGSSDDGAALTIALLGKEGRRESRPRAIRAIGDGKPCRAALLAVDQPHLVRLYHSSRNDGIDTESAAWALLAVVLIGPKAWRMRDNPAVLVTVLALLLWLFS